MFGLIRFKRATRRKLLERHLHRHKKMSRQALTQPDLGREIMLFIGKPKGRSKMISNVHLCSSLPGGRFKGLYLVFIQYKSM